MLAETPVAFAVGNSGCFKSKVDKVNRLIPVDTTMAIDRDVR